MAIFAENLYHHDRKRHFPIAQGWEYRRGVGCHPAYVLPLRNLGK
jgi:hypothetical protein